MVRGARSGASSGRGLYGRVLFQASACSSPSVPPSGEFTPPQPRGSVASPSSVSPTVAAAVGAASVSPPLAAPALAAGSGQSTHSPNTVVGSVPEDVVSLQEGGGSFYESTLREVWINGYEKELKRLPTFQEVFDRTHKKKGTDQYISNRALEVAESYSQQMTEKYVREDEQPQLDLEVWVTTSGAPKKGHVYGFGHSMDTSKVLSGASSSASQTSAFNTGVGAPGNSPSDMMGFITNTISGLESRIAQTMETRLV
ncbi:hypothetical protein Taro_014329 [Colocasia esculenta]|uniref:Uncharacterized protein n=1 Tax=Colocasia esculenta TaxID=4460 RepID=A0A843UE76_COLES|nr:hypothetical protein [Colocasia esculenta]